MAGRGSFTATVAVAPPAMTIGTGVPPLEKPSSPVTATLVSVTGSVGRFLSAGHPVHREVSGDEAENQPWPTGNQGLLKALRR